MAGYGVAGYDRASSSRASPHWPSRRGVVSAGVNSTGGNFVREYDWQRVPVRYRDADSGRGSLSELAILSSVSSHCNFHS